MRRSDVRIPEETRRFTGSGVPSSARSARSRTSIGRSPGAAVRNASTTRFCCGVTRFAARIASSQPSARSTNVRVTVPTPRFTAEGVMDASVIPTGQT